MNTILLVTIGFILWGSIASWIHKQRQRKKREARYLDYAHSSTVIPSDITFKLRGLSYRAQNEISAARLLDKYDRVVLRREPTNEYDKYAIMVLTRTGKFIGYVDREYSKFLSQNFDYLIAEISSIKQYKIPEIEIHVKIALEPSPQPTVESDPKKMSASERMMVLEDIVEQSSTPIPIIPPGYCQYGFEISWTEELPRGNILRAKDCKVGDALTLIPQEPTRYPGRIEVFTTDNVLIGYIDEERHRNLSKYIDKIRGASIYTTDEWYRLQGILFIPLVVARLIPPSSGYFDYPYKEVREASNIVKSDPALALDMLQYAIAHEKRITAKDEALRCYWYLKDWEGRRTMALRMLNIIDSINSDELNPFTYERLKNRECECLIGIIEYSEKKLQPKKKK